jgi:hypothetical protein
MDDVVVLRQGTRVWTPQSVTLVSFDPAIKNLAVLVEQRSAGQRTVHAWERWSLPDDGTYPAVVEHLERLRAVLERCDVAVIERQNPISKGAQIHTNSKVMRMFGFLTGWLIAAFPALTVVDLSPKAKGRVLGAPKGLTYAQTKAWSVATAKTLLEGHTALTTLTQRGGGKKDDLADVLVQAETFLRLTAQNAPAP